MCFRSDFFLVLLYHFISGKTSETMSVPALPNDVNYAELAPRIPEGTDCVMVTQNPINIGTSINGLSAGSQIIFDLNQEHFLDPNSLYVTYQYAFTNLVSAEMLGATPCTSIFQNCQVQIGGTIVESQLDYGILCSHRYTMSTNPAERYGWSPSSGTVGVGIVPTLETVSDGRLLTVNETGSFSFPLMCCLSTCNKYIPLGSLPQIRIILTLAPIAQWTTTVVATPTVLSLSNVTLDYRQIRFPPGVAASVNNMVDESGSFWLKMTGWAVQATTLAGAVSGNLAIATNLRYSSVRSLFAFFGQNGATTTCRDYDSVDLTNSNGSYQWSIAGVPYPQKPLLTAYSKARGMMLIRDAMGSVHDRDVSPCINIDEWSYSGGTAAATTFAKPSKFIFATNLEKIGSEALLSGVSTQLSPIMLNILTNASIGANSSTVRVAVCYDMLIQVFPRERQFKLNV